MAGFTTYYMYIFNVYLAETKLSDITNNVIIINTKTGNGIMLRASPLDVAKILSRTKTFRVAIDCRSVNVTALITFSEMIQFMEVECCIFHTANCSIMS